MDERNVIDVTSFLLFESTGDSEEPDPDLNISTNSSGQEISMAELVDDAQSCSDLLGPKELCDLDHDQEHVDNLDHYDSHHGYDENHHVVEDDDDDDAIDQVWSSCGKLVLQKKSKVCVDYSKMNERDKDRHFWETCLAS